MHVSELIRESRKYPKLNLKTPINKIIADKLADTRDHIAGVTNLFVSLTKIDKLGVNPNSKYDTPIGIYSYSAEYVMREIGDDNPLTVLPFAGSSPFVNIFSVQGNIVNLVEMSEATFAEYIQKIINVFDQYTSSSSQLEYYISSKPPDPFRRTPGGRLWYITQKASRLLADAPKWHATQSHVAWTKLFREIGIDGCVDTGLGIIHQDEPAQAVFFRTSTIINNSRHYNKYAPAEHRQSNAKGAKIASEKHAINQEISRILSEPDSINQVIKLLTDPEVSFGSVKLSQIPEEVITYIIKNHPELFQQQPLLPDHIQQQLIQSTPRNIQYIKNPSQSIESQVVQRNPTYIQYINNPHINTQLTAIKLDPYNIRHIYNPAPVVQLAAINVTPDVIRIIKQPTPDAQLAAIQQDPSIIKSFRNPAEFLKIAAIRADPASILYIPNPSRKIALMAFVMINRLSEFAQIAAINNDAGIIKYITNPSEAVQLAVIKKNPQYYRYIKNLTPAAEDLFIDLTSDLPVDR